MVLRSLRIRISRTLVGVHPLKCHQRFHPEEPQGAQKLHTASCTVRGVREREDLVNELSHREVDRKSSLQIHQKYQSLSCEGQMEARLCHAGRADVLTQAFGSVP